MEAAGKETVHFTKDDRVYSFGVGDTIDGKFRIDQVTPQGVQITYLPQNQKRFIAYSSGSAPPAPETYPVPPSMALPMGHPRASTQADAEAAAQASATAAAVMGISPPATSTMPLSAPTITSMPVLEPGVDMPISAPSGAPMVVTPPVAR
jgi:hypothetical protein